MQVTRKSVLIEVGEDAAGVLIEGARGFQFHAVHPQLQHLQGTRFSTVQAAENAARQGLRPVAQAG